MNKNLKKQIKRYQFEICVGLVSLIALIIGSIGIGFIKSLVIIGIVDCLLLFPAYLNRKPVKGKHVKGKKNNSSNNENKKDINKKVKKKKWWKKVLLVFLIMFIAGILLFSAFMAYIVITAPKFDPNNLYRQESTILYDKNGKEFARLGAEKREKIKYSEISEVLVDAIIATEDSRYFQHNGFDLPRFLKASAGQLSGQNSGGASTLTMQVSKNNYTSTEASGFEGIKRKFTDIYMSIFQIERNYTKEEIIEFYVNQPYLGSGAYGVEQACQTYFGKAAKDINLAEAAMIAGLFQAPNSYDPNLHPENSEARRKTVLYLMKRHGYINDEEYNEAIKLDVTKLVKASTKEANKYQSFIDTVIEDVEDKTKQNPYNVAMKIYTTMDSDKQGYLDDIMSGKTFTWENDKVNAGISIIDSNTGAIVAVGAGRNRTGERSFNTATMINRQIGSTSKPLYDYAMGFEKLGWSTYTPFADEPYTYSNGTKVENWNRTFNGYMTLRTALAESRNIPALKAFQKNNIKDIQNFVKSVGLSPEETFHEAHALGGYNGESPLTVSGAYQVFASGGYYTTPHSFTKIVYRENDKEFKPDTKRNKVLSEETAYMMSSVLQDAAKWGVGRNVTTSGATFAAKTGTSNYDSKIMEAYNMPSNAVNDLWIAGYSPDYSISVWYGYDKITRGYVSTTNTSAQRRLFLQVANEMFEKGSTFKRPSGVIDVAVENYTYPAKLPSEYTPKELIKTELFKKGTEPTEVSPRFTKLATPKNLKSSVSGNTLTLTWDKVTPSLENSIKISDLFSNSSYAASFQGMLNNQNNAYIGSFGYNIYSVNSSGGLSLVKFVTTNKGTITVTSSSPTNYVVKATYSKSTASMSDASNKTTVNLGSVVGSYDALLVGSDTANLVSGDTYSEAGIKLTENGSVVQNGISYNITISSTNGTSDTVTSLSEVSANINTTSPATYTITYKITYKTYTKTLTRIVIVS